MPGKCIIVSAPSGAGKTTIVRRLLKAGMGLEFSVSATSRPPRQNERHGKDYYFISAEAFRNKIHNGELLEWQEVYKDHYYGTLKSEVDRIWGNGRHVIFDVDVKGGINLKKKFPEVSLSLFIMPPSPEELEKRLKLRSSDTPEAIAMRVQKAAEELESAGKFDRVIVNNDLETAVMETITAVRQFLET
ncbi:MAG: guanylate kinase [Bacteroidales bacterium]|nr:guanylate kinase [Bacteroidales bacterium]